MSKKIMLGIVVVALLAGTETLIAMGRKGKPKAEQMQKQKGRAKQQPKHRKADIEKRWEHMDGLVQKQKGLRRGRKRSGQQQFDK